MEEDYSFFEDNFLIAISGDGRITSVQRKENEYAHYQPFIRLDHKIALSKIINANCTALDAPNICAKDGYIIIYPINMDEYELKKIIFGVVFPFKPSKEQLELLISLYEQLKKIKIVYFEKPSIDRDLDYRQRKYGLEDLKKFVEEKLELLNEQNNLGKEREWK